MSSTATRKRARGADEGDDALITSTAAIKQSFAVDRTNSHDNKRQRLTAPTSTSSTEDVAVSAVPFGWNNRRVASVGSVTWAEEAVDHTQLTPALAASGLTSPPAGFVSDRQPPPFSRNLPASIPIPRQNWASGPRIIRSNPIPDDAEDSEGANDDEDYDPDEGQADIGLDSDDVSDQDEAEDDGDESDNGDGDSGHNKTTTSSPKPLSGMNAFLHELHFSHRRTRPPPPPTLARTPSLTSAAEPASPSSKHATLLLTTNGNIGHKVPAIDCRAVETAREAALRRESLQKATMPNSLAVESKAAARSPPAPSLAIEQSSVSAQYEETNRYVGPEEPFPISLSA